MSSVKTVVLRVSPSIESFAYAMRLIGLSALRHSRIRNKFLRVALIRAKQESRDSIRAARRKPLIHNGRKPR